MSKYFFYLIKKNKGFTLVELLLVIIILVILAGIAIPSYAIVSNKTRETATELEMNNIAKALEVYIAEKYTYPSEAAYPEALIASKIMDNVPINDSWEIPYDYTSSGGSSYILKSYGINKADGGNDDIVFINGTMTEEGAYSSK
jgi:general secretion pathway protein G